MVWKYTKKILIGLLAASVIGLIGCNEPISQRSFHTTKKADIDCDEKKDKVTSHEYLQRSIDPSNPNKLVVYTSDYSFDLVMERNLGNDEFGDSEAIFHTSRFIDSWEPIDYDGDGRTDIILYQHIRKGESIPYLLRNRGNLQFDPLKRLTKEDRKSVEGKIKYTNKIDSMIEQYKGACRNIERESAIEDIIAHIESTCDIELDEEERQMFAGMELSREDIEDFYTRSAQYLEATVDN